MNEKLYTWVDVQELILNQTKQWPDQLIFAQVYWSGLTLGVKLGSEEVIKEFLINLFDPRYNNERNCLILEDKSELQVIFEEAEEPIQLPIKRPTLKRPDTIYKNYKLNSVPELPLDSPEIFCFHSFKGGVGRTLHAISLAKAFANDGKKILLIDSDLEAPGITYLAYSTLMPEISYVDFLALLHSDDDPTFKKSIDYVASVLQSQQRDNIYILPAFRKGQDNFSIGILPEDIILNFQDGYNLTNSIAELGKILKVDAVIIDARAGISDISTGLILDHRINRIFVSSISGQSIEGTVKFLNLIAPTEDLPSNFIIPFVILTQIPENYKDKLSFIKEEFNKAFFKTDEKDGNFLVNSFNENETFSGSFSFIESEFNQQLIVLPIDWDEVLRKVESTSLVSLLGLLTLDKNSPATEIIGLSSKRKLFKEKTETLIFAETGEVNNFHWLHTLKNLSKDFALKTPNVVIFGAKGSGKTLLFIKLLKSKQWEIFVKDSNTNSNIKDAILFPVLSPLNLQSKANVIRDECLKNAQDVFGFKQTEFDIRGYIRENLRKSLDETKWKDIWLNAIAYSAGYNTDDEGAGKKLILDLSEKKVTAVGLFDGIEDLFQSNEEIITNAKALRGLIQELPDFLDKQINKSLGVIIVIRQDFIDYAIQQNSAQYRDKYKSYELRWNHKEALKLAYSVANEFSGIGSMNSPNLDTASIDELSKTFSFLWGLKLGPDKSKEAYSLRWILTALSDWNNQIQARDLIRFLFKSSEKSINDNNANYNERLLIPLAIKESFGYCSGEKAKEVSQENKTLDAIFKKLIQEKNKQMPFEKDELKITQEEIDILEKNGIVRRDNEKYFVAEIYREGLGFKINGKGRRRISAFSKLDI